jgi:hypothetical protein
MSGSVLAAESGNQYPHMVVDRPRTNPTLICRNRRASPRLIADRLPWLERMRLAGGACASVIDLSVHGALFDVAVRLHPGDTTKFELIAADDRAVVTGRVVRSEISSFGPDGIRYRGACRFDRPLPWSGRLSAPAPALPVLKASDHPSWTGWSEVQLIFRHGRCLRGYTHGFHPATAIAHVWPSCAGSNREPPQTVPLSLLRHIAFVRDFDDAGRPQPATSETNRSAHAVEVTFQNNDALIGTIPGYDPGQIGFWILPSGRRGVDRVFAISAAVREICFF